jgi:hypothetical protein
VVPLLFHLVCGFAEEPVVAEELHVGQKLEGHADVRLIGSCEIEAAEQRAGGDRNILRQIQETGPIEQHDALNF